MATSAGISAATRPLAARSSRADTGGRASYLVWMLVVYLVLEYARPPVIVQLKLQMLISLVLPALCIALIKDRGWSRILTCQLGVLAVATIGVLYATNNYTAYLITRLLFTTVAMSLAVAWLLSRLSFFRVALWTWTLILTYVGIYSIFHGGFGPGGIVGDENEVALACNTAVPMAYFGFTGSRGWRRWAYAGIGVVLLCAIVISNSRGGFVGLVAVVGYAVLVSKQRLRALIGLSIAFVVFLLAAPRTYIDEILSIQKETSGEIEDGTGDTRYFLWTAAFNMWKAYPVLGVGAGNSMYHVGKFQPDWEGAIYENRDWSGTAIHSGFFELLCETGAAGVALYAAIITGHFSHLRRVRRTARAKTGLSPEVRGELEMYSSALAGGMIGYLASGLFLSVAYFPFPYYFSAMALALTWSMEHELSRAAALDRRPTRTATGNDPSSRFEGLPNGQRGSSSLGGSLL